MSRAAKGSDFERELCKKLSLWWTKGERDDVFWRSSQSGGRATQRAKFGKRTYGSYGDIAAVDPIGEPLLRLFTIELKRGSSYGCPGDLLDFKEKNGSHPFAKCLLQAVRSHQDAGSVSWMLIGRRDHRCAIVYMRTKRFKKFQWAQNRVLLRHVRFRLGIEGTLFDFVGVQLDDFLKAVTPEQIMECLKIHEQSQS